MGRRKKQQPDYTLHKASGKARVRIDGVDIYLGPYDSPESWQKYNQLMLQRLNGGRPIPEDTLKPGAASEQLVVAEFVERYIEHAKLYYGEDHQQRYRIVSATRPLLALFASLPVSEFGPLKLSRVIEQLIREGDTRKEVAKHGFRPLSRKTVNDYLALLKRMFEWGVSQQLVASPQYVALKTVKNVRTSRGELARLTTASRRVLPVKMEDVEKTLAKCSKEIAAMIQTQLLTAMRPDEVTIMQPCSIDCSDPRCWIYVPGQHKNSWREGMEHKEVFIGPRAQAILKPWLEACENESDYLFSPLRVAERFNLYLQERNGKPSPYARLSQARPPRDHYDDQSYRQAVRRACRRAGVTVWTPNQLRHTTGTDVQAKFGAEGVKLMLGHRHLKTGEFYAERDREKYRLIVNELG